ncbi:hypothetical protein NQ315_016204 [Exocentrus adspersus]|uniref:Reverse transcriptase domain-containing protein n=1 Tax=Exocentrus adspersus TaxID=1586481 RepID=A0AAV8VJ21_9CUCU|nr:hypothetical protein NQ315_016204 [Exocentrus adspersus]
MPPNIPPEVTKYGEQKRQTGTHTKKIWKDIQITFAKNETLVAVFLNIKGAYDSDQLDILASKLHIIGLPSRIIKNLISIHTPKNTPQNRRYHHRTTN